VCLPNRALVPPRPSGLPHRRNGAAASVPKRRPVGAGVTRNRITRRKDAWLDPCRRMNPAARVVSSPWATGAC
jgi:hypothetical protein